MRTSSPVVQGPILWVWRSGRLAVRDGVGIVARVGRCAVDQCGRRLDGPVGVPVAGVCGRCAEQWSGWRKTKELRRRLWRSAGLCADCGAYSEQYRCRSCRP